MTCCRWSGWAVAAVLALAFAGCAPSDDVPPRVALAGTTDELVEACLDGDHDAALDALDDRVSEAPNDPATLVARGTCRWARWAESEDEEDARAAYQDLSDAADLLEAGADGPPLDAVLSRRAFVARALDGGWVRTLEDLDRAVAEAPAQPRHVLDRGVVHLYAGDSTAARRDLARFLDIADSADTNRQRVAEAMLSDLGPEPVRDTTRVRAVAP